MFLDFKRMQHFAMPARAATSNVTTVRTNNYFQGNNLGQATRYEGIAGWGGPTAGTIPWPGSYGAPSYSNTQIEDISNTALVVEGSNLGCLVLARRWRRHFPRPPQLLCAMAAG